MRSRVISVLGLAGILIIGACGSSTDEKPTAKAGSSAGNSTSAGTATNASNGNTTIVANGALVPGETVDPNAGETTAATDTLEPPNRMKARLNKWRQAGASSTPVDAEAVALENARPAPDDSTFTSYLSDVGYELRTFRSHPQLLKVQKRIDSKGNQTLKIFLRNGKVVQRPGSAVPALASAPAATILAAAGIAPPSQPPNQTAKKPSGN